MLRTSGHGPQSKDKVYSELSGVFRMKKFLILAILFLIFVSPCAYSQSSDTGDEALGQCHLESGTFHVYQNKRKNIFKFLVTSGLQTKEVIFDRNFVWFWADVDVLYWKFRNGRNNGIFSWDQSTGIGHLKYVKGDYFYWNLTECQIDESKI